MASANDIIETPTRIEPAGSRRRRKRSPMRSQRSLRQARALGTRLHPATAANLSDLVRLMNCYYSNLIEGHNTRPRDIARAISRRRAIPWNRSWRISSGAIASRGRVRRRASWPWRPRITVELHSSLPGRQWPGEPSHEPRHGAEGRDRRPWPVVGVARSRPGPRQRPGIQGTDGPCRYAASGRSGWARQPLAEGTCRLHSVVSEGLPRPGDLHGGTLRPRQSGRPPGAPCRAQRQAETRSRAPAARSPGRGRIHRGEASRITGLPERTARRVLGDIVDAGLLASATPKGPVSLRFPSDTLEGLFPRFYPDT